MKVKSLKLNAFLNLVKQACSILFPLITFPYVSRVLGSNGFGQYNFSFTVADYFIIFAALGISSYAIREGAKYRNNRDITEKFCREVFTINCISTVIAVIALAFVFLLFRSLDNYRMIIIIISSQMILATVGADWINSIYEDYIYITLRYIVIQVISLILIFVYVRDSSDIAKYAVITTFASAGGNLLNILYVRKYVKLKFVLSGDLLRHLKPVLILFANTLAISIYVNADITMLKFYQPDSVVGLYSLASRIYNITKRLISAMIIVTTARLAFYSKNDNAAYKTTAKRTFNALIFILLPCMAGLITMSRQIVLLVGGPEYIDAWLPLCILSVAMLFALASSFYSNCVLIIFDCDRALLTATSVSALVNVGLNLIILPWIGMTGAAITTLIAEAINFGVQLFYSKKIIGDKLLEKEDLIKTIIGTAIVLVICLIVNHYTGIKILGLLIAIPLSCICYFGFSLACHNTITEFLLSFRKKHQ